MKKLILYRLRKYQTWRKEILAFTLLELLVVVAIIAILLAFLLPKLKASKCSTALIDLKKYVDDLRSSLANNPNPSQSQIDSYQTGLQAKINAVKRDCNDPKSSISNELKNSINQLVTEIDIHIANSENPSWWDSLKGTIGGFITEYF
jgi:prepilin-type N-terminal cleavage/methylation domain-containing protein